MAKIATTLAFVLWLAAPGGQLSADIHNLVGKQFQAHVISIVDGDTVDIIADDWGKIRVRLDAIDAPERREAYSDRATRFTRVLLFDKTVRADARDVDRYGRLVARLVTNGVDASVALVQAGLACHYKLYSSDATLAADETAARLAGRGFWAAGVPKPRCTLRNPTLSTQTAKGAATAATNGGPFHGNTRSHVYHRPQCRNYSCPNCTKVFLNQEEARAAGYRPAEDCLGRSR